MEDNCMGPSTDKVYDLRYWDANDSQSVREASM